MSPGPNEAGVWVSPVSLRLSEFAESRGAYAHVVAGTGFSIESLAGACPTQATGHCADGRPFYFWARHGDWELYVGPSGAPTDGSWIGDSQWITARGCDPIEGRMPPDGVRTALRLHLGPEAANG